MAVKSREKILLYFVIIAIAIWAFDLFYYTPQKKRISILKEEIKAADLKLKESSVFTQGVETLETEVSRLEKDLRGVNERTLTGGEFRAFLKHLATDSDRLQMKMVSLSPQEEKITSLEQKKPASAPQYKKVTVHMVVHSTYASLESYLKKLEDLPLLIRVEHLQIERSEEILPFLKVTMGLSVLTLL